MQANIPQLVNKLCQDTLLDQVPTVAGVLEAPPELRSRLPKCEPYLRNLTCLRYSPTITRVSPTVPSIAVTLGITPTPWSYGRQSLQCRRHSETVGNTSRRHVWSTCSPTSSKLLPAFLDVGDDSETTVDKKMSAILSEMSATSGNVGDSSTSVGGSAGRSVAMHQQLPQVSPKLA